VCVFVCVCVCVCACVCVSLCCGRGWLLLGGTAHVNWGAHILTPTCPQLLLLLLLLLLLPPCIVTQPPHQPTAFIPYWNFPPARWIVPRQRACADALKVCQLQGSGRLGAQASGFRDPQDLGLCRATHTHDPPTHPAHTHTHRMHTRTYATNQPSTPRPPSTDHQQHAGRVDSQVQGAGGRRGQGV
jgi:hypothetical protein